MTACGDAKVGGREEERAERGFNTYAHGKGTTKVIENDVGAGVASVIHGCRRGKKGWTWEIGLRRGGGR
jgi:hypothetical protein